MVVAGIVTDNDEAHRIVNIVSVSVVLQSISPYQSLIRATYTRIQHRRHIRDLSHKENIKFIK